MLNLFFNPFLKVCNPIVLLSPRYPLVSIPEVSEDSGDWLSLTMDIFVTLGLKLSFGVW